MVTLKTNGYWELNKYSTLKYFKNGKANMHVETSYCIEFNNSKYYEDHGTDLDVSTGVFWIKTLRDANKEWNNFKKTRTLSGAVLKVELFNEVGTSCVK